MKLLKEVRITRIQFGLSDTGLLEKAENVKTLEVMGLQLRRLQISNVQTPGGIWSPKDVVGIRMGVESRRYTDT